MLNVTTERLQQIEAEREQTFSNPDFQKWFRELNIGVLAQKASTQAQDMMNLWTDRHGNRNSFQRVVARLKA